MTEQSPAQAHAAAVRKQVESLPRFGHGDRETAILAIVLASEQFADQHARGERVAERRHAADLIGQAQAERDTARRELEQAHDAYRKVIAERTEANDHAQDWARRCAQALQERDEAAAERDRLRGLLNEAAIADPGPGPAPAPATRPSRKPRSAAKAAPATGGGSGGPRPSAGRTEPRGENT